MSHINFALDWTVGVYCVNKGRVLLVLHRNMSQWLPPGGHIEPNEIPDDAAKREFLEEVGLDVRLHFDEKWGTNPNVTGLVRPAFMDIHDVPKFPHHRHIGLFYFGTLANSEEEKPSLCKDEHDDVQWFTAEQIKTLQPMNESNRYYALSAIKTLGD